MCPHDLVGQVAQVVERRVRLGESVRELGERVRRPNPEAGRNARPAQHGRAHVAGEFEPVPWAHVGQVEEGLVNGVALDLWRVLAVDRVHAGRHVTAERVVGREHPDAVGSAEFSHLEVGRPSRSRAPQPRRCGRWRSRRCLQHDNGNASKPGVEDPLAGAVEVVPVRQGVGAGRHHRWAGRRRLIDPDTTPHTSTVTSGGQRKAG